MHHNIRVYATARHCAAEGQTISRENTVLRCNTIVATACASMTGRGGVYIITRRIMHFRDEPCCAGRYNAISYVIYPYNCIIIYNVEVGNPSSVAAYMRSFWYYCFDSHARGGCGCGCNLYNNFIYIYIYIYAYNTR